MSFSSFGTGNPQISDFQIIGNSAQIDFSAPATNMPSAFRLQSASSASGPFISVSNCSIFGIAPGKFRATAPLDETMRFYRVHVAGSPAWIEDFSAQALDQSPNGWSPMWLTENGVWQVVEREGTRQLRQIGITNGYYALRWDALGAVANVELLGLAQPTANGGGTQNRLIVRAAGAAGSENGYTLDVRDGTTRIFRFINGSGVALGASVSIGTQAETWFWMRFRAEGNQLKGKIWPAGAPEPPAWTLERTDSNIANAGHVGVGAWSSNGIRYFDYIAAETDGGSPAVPSQLVHDVFAFKPMKSQQPIAANGVFGFSATSAFMAGQYGTMARFDGNQWIPFFLSTPNNGHFYGVWGSSPNDVWAVGSYGNLARWNGSAWSYVGQVSGGYLQTAIWGTASNNIWSVGSGGRAYRYDGSSWTAQGQLPTSGETLRGIFGFAPNEIYAVGDLGKIVGFNGSSWSVLANANTNRLNGIWGTSANNLFAVGNNGTIRRFNGSTWSADPQSGSVTTKSLRSIWGLSATNIYAAGDEGTLLRYDGVSWSLVNAPTWTHDLQGIWSDGDGSVFAVGYNGGAVQGVTRQVNLGQPSQYQFQFLTDPARTEVRDTNGNWIATYTLGSFTMTHRGPLRSFVQSSVSVQHNTWVRILPEPFDGRIDVAWLEAALNDTSPDILQISMQYIANAPPIFAGGLQIAGESGYGDGIGSDFNDYLGINYLYSSGTVITAQAERFQTMDCSGFMRMLFGYRGTPYRVPVSSGGIPRTSNDQCFYGCGTAVIPYTTNKITSVELARLMPGDVVFFKSTSRDPDIDHVGYYLGRDNSNRYRFISSLGGTVGPRFGTSLYVLDGNNTWADKFRSARRF